MAKSMTRAEVEYHFNYDVTAGACPLCGAEFAPRIGSWPFLAGTSTPICGGPDCPVGADVTGPSPCDTLFEFTALSEATLDALSAEDLQGETVAERFRRVAQDEALPDPDRAVLQLAAIDLMFCEADATRIRQVRPLLVVLTCGEAAAEMLLSGCGDILEGV